MHTSVNPALRWPEKLLLGPGPCVLRVLLGFVFLYVTAPFRASDRWSFWALVALLLATLLALRAALVCVRALLPFSRHLQEAWFRERQQGKRFDSYQWSKLFWIGLGMAAYLAGEARAQPNELALVVTCIAAGATGMLFWHRVQARSRRERTSVVKP
jgi:hypothetical protein